MHSKRCKSMMASHGDAASRSVDADLMPPPPPPMTVYDDPAVIAVMHRHEDHDALQRAHIWNKDAPEFVPCTSSVGCTQESDLSEDCWTDHDDNYDYDIVSNIGRGHVRHFTEDF